MLTSPIEPSLDPSQRVLSLPLAALYEAPIALGALAGLPAGALDIVSASIVASAMAPTSTSASSSTARSVNA